MRIRTIIPALLLAGRCTGADTNMPPVATQPGRMIYEAKCAKCHRFYDPRSYHDTQWNIWMDKMHRKARLTEEQFDQLVRYLQTVRHPGAQTPPLKEDKNQETTSM